MAQLLTKLEGVKWISYPEPLNPSFAPFINKRCNISQDMLGRLVIEFPGSDDVIRTSPASVWKSFGNQIFFRTASNNIYGFEKM